MLKRFMVTVAALTIVVSPAYASIKLAGWSNTTWNMTPEAAIKAIKPKLGSKPVINCAQVMPDKCSAYRVENFKLMDGTDPTNLDINGRSGKFLSVSLIWKGIPAEWHYNTIKTALTLKYGEPVEESTPLGKKVIWLLGKTTIELSYFDPVTGLDGEPVAGDYTDLTYIPSEVNDNL